MSKRAGKQKSPRSLAATLVTAFLALTLAALLIANLSVLLFFGRAIQESVDSRQQLVAREAANTVATFVQEKFDELETTAKIGQPTSTSPEGQRDILGNLLGFVPAFRQLILFNAQDQDMARVSRISQAAAGQLATQIDPDLFFQVRQGNRYVSPVFIDELTSEPMIIMAVPATNVFGDFQGTLLAEVNLKFMWDLVDSLPVGETGLAYVVDDQGNLLAFGDISRVLRGDNVSQLELVGDFMHSAVPGGQAATRTVQGIDGNRVVGTYVPLRLPDWAVVVELPLGEAFRPGIQSTVVLSLVMLAVTILVGLMSVYIARRLATPLLNLTTTAGRIAGGEMDLRAAQEGPAEVVDLARAFNSMTAQLSELIGSLEQRVADRTHALEQQAMQLATAAEVGRVAASILELEALTRQVVELIRDRFDLYYAGLFLLDDAGQYAVLEAGSGEPGRLMKSQGHKLQIGGVSMVGAACARRQPRIALDVGEEAVRFDNPLLPETRSEMALPLMVGDRVLGALDVQSTRPTAFSDQDVAVLELMADQVAVAVDNAQKLSEEATLVEATNPLFRVSRQLSAAATSSQVAQVIIGSVSETEADLCAVAQYGITGSGEVTTITFLTAWERRGPSQFPIGAPLPASEPMFPMSLMMQPLIIEDMRLDPRVPDRTRHILARTGALALANIPLRMGDRLLGFVIIGRVTAGSWSPVSIRLYETLADQSAVALERARLLEESQLRADRERLIREITDRMRSAADMDSLMRTAVQEIAAALGTNNAILRLAAPFDPVGGDGQNGDDGKEL
jgi:GAF domain-containing protein/HAMP domain-containing protein